MRNLHGPVKRLLLWNRTGSPGRIYHLANGLLKHQYQPRLLEHRSASRIADLHQLPRGLSLRRHKD